MLPLDDTRWRELKHAYGSAADVPELLRALALSTGPKNVVEDEPWSSLWSMLCHQGDVYTASYAAVPHIVGIARSAHGSIDPSFFSLPAAIEIARRAGNGSDLPQAYAEDYRSAIGSLVEVASLHRTAGADQTMILSLAAAQAVASGHIGLAEALLNLDDDWIARINSDDRD